MKNKYYTPNIEDIHVGYECEEGGWDIKNNVRNWHPFVWDKYKPAEDLEGYAFRTPFLTKEQIEAERWVYNSMVSNENGEPIAFQFLKGKYLLAFNVEKHSIAIMYAEKYYDHIRTFYEGDCPSINEFRTIIKLLKI